MEYFAVIDTETNLKNKVISIGVTIGDSSTYKAKDYFYVVIEPDCNYKAMYSQQLFLDEQNSIRKQVSRMSAIDLLKEFLEKYRVKKIFAYNAKFDYSHLKEIQSYKWYDIMKIAGNKNYNKAIPSDAECYANGRLKSKYGVQPIYQLLSKNNSYYELHNALQDSMDELRIMDYLNLPFQVYEDACINGTTNKQFNSSKQQKKQSAQEPDLIDPDLITLRKTLVSKKKPNQKIISNSIANKEEQSAFIVENHNRSPFKTSDTITGIIFGIVGFLLLLIIIFFIVGFVTY